MRLILLALTLFSGLNILGCGGYYPYIDTNVYFNILDQTIISDNSFDPFLRFEFEPFYNDDEDFYSKTTTHGNLELWKKKLPSLTLEQIEKILYRQPDSEDIWKAVNSDDREAIREYIDFADICSVSFHDRTSKTWSYEKILRRAPDNLHSIELEALSKFNSAKDEQLKLRYGFQLTRIYHYSKKYEKAIKFFENEVQDQFEKNEMYYYLLDQLAGCYFSLDQKQTAGKLFLEVIAFSTDRKKSASISYRWCSPLDLSLEEYPDLYLTQQILKYDYNPEIAISLLENYALLDPNNPRLEVVVMREINYIERIKFPHPAIKYYSTEEEETAQTEFRTIYSSLKKITGKILSKKDLKNKDFWRIMNSYLFFLKDDYSGAKRELKAVNGKEHLATLEALKLAYEVFSWNSIDPKKEKILGLEMASIFGEKGFTDRWIWENIELKESWKFGVLNQVAKLYLNQEDHAKSYLCHGTTANLHSLSSEILTNEVRKFHHKRNKNSFEELLSKNLNFSDEWLTNEKARNKSIDDYLNYCSGLIFMQNDEPHLALPYLEAQTIEKTSKLIFSNNILERSKKPKMQNLTDSVVFSDWFSFIPEELSLKEQAEVLIRLKSMAKNSHSNKGILANYLLGNYYFNTSNTGYFKENLRNYAYSQYKFFSQHLKDPTSLDELITKKAISDFYRGSKHYVTDLELATISFGYYEKVMDNSTNKELKGRTLYMLAKCELNRYYNEADEIPYYYFNPWSVKKFNTISNTYLTSFKQLENSYSETEIYDRIIKECSFFRWYVDY